MFSLLLVLLWFVDVNGLYFAVVILVGVNVNVTVVFDVNGGCCYSCVFGWLF